jgi:hypothetical protein
MLAPSLATCMEFAASTPDVTAEAKIAALSTQPDFEPVEANGAARCSRISFEIEAEIRW